MPPEVTYTMDQLFTKRERQAIVQLWNTCPPREFHKQVLERIVTPALPRINAFTKQENDARYLAYAIEASITANTARQ